jgi:hypothetical protein
MKTVLEDVLPKSSVQWCVSCGQKDSVQKIFIKKCFLCTVASVCRVKRSTTGWQTFATFLDKVVNCFTLQTLLTVEKGKISLRISVALSPFAHRKKRNRMLLFGSTILKHGRHFDYWNQPVKMSMLVWYLACHEAGLWCYLVIHIETLLHPLQLFYFYLCPVYWLSLVNH